MQNEKYVKLAEASRRYGVPPRTLRRWCAMDKVSCYRVGPGRIWYIDIQALELSRIHQPLT
jgi:hypothetical protein